MSDPNYKEGTVATRGNVTTIDITHKPKRLQGQNIPIEKQVGTVKEQVVVDTTAPKGVTLESAIHYYEENAVGELAPLYSMTAQWLKSYRKNRNTKAIEALLEKAKENESEEES